MVPPVRLSPLLLLLFSVCSVAQELSVPQTETSAPPDYSSDLYLKVRLNSPLKVSKLKPGDQVSGRLLQDVYSGDTEVFLALSAVSLTVDRLDSRRRVPNDHWPWVIRAFTPRHESCPVFRSANVTSPEGNQISLQVSLVSVSKEVEVEPKVKKDTNSAISERAAPKRTRLELGSIVTLVASLKNPNGNLSTTLPTESVTVPTGTEANVILLRDVRASKDHANDTFQARLVQPVRLNSRNLLPEGTLFNGRVTKSRAPRTLSRSGSIDLTFTSLTIPGGRSRPIAASVAGAEMSQRSHTVIDQEGRMHGDRPGKAWMLLNVGVTAGISKEVDDGTQLIIEALVSTATDASTAGTAKIVSTCASAIFLLTRHGRDVVLPKYTQMKIVFDRPVQLPD